MLTRSKTFAGVTVLLLLAFLTAACGGATATDTPVAAPTATIAAMVAPTDTTAAMPAPTDTVAMAAPTNTAATMPAPTDTAAAMAAPTNTAAAMSGSAATPDASLKGTVTFWNAYNTVSPEMNTLTQQLIPAFEKLYPNVKVTAQALPYDDLRQKLLTAVAGGETPDLVRADIIWVPEFAEIGALAKLDQVMPDFNTIKEAVYPGPLSTNFYKGNYYGLPLDTNTRVQFYNKDVYKQAGVASVPTTFDEFKAACEKIKALGKADTFCFSEGGTGAWNVLPWIWSAGGSVTDDQYTKATGYLNSKATVDAVTMLHDWLKAGYISQTIMGSGGSTSDELGKAQVGTIVDGPWMPPIFEKQYAGLNYSLAPFPAGPGGSVSVVGGEDIVMFDKTQNKDAALAFMRFMLGAEAQTALGKVGQMPVLKSLSGSPDLPAYYAVFQKQLETAKARTPSPAWPKIDTAISDAVLSVFRDEKQPQAALDEAAATVDGLLAGKK